MEIDSAEKPKQLDETSKRILLSLVGTVSRSFRDGLLYDATISAMGILWKRLDYVHDGVLQEKDFVSARGVDPIWEALLESCDLDGDGNISQTEFCAGFVMAALNKPMALNGQTFPAKSSITGMEVMKNLTKVLNDQVMDEVAVVNKKMGYTA